MTRERDWDWDPRDLMRTDIDFEGRGAVQWWGPWAPHGAEGSTTSASVAVTRLLEGIGSVDLSGWEGPAARAAGEARERTWYRAVLLEDQLAAATVATRVLDEAVRDALLHAAGAG